MDGKGAPFPLRCSEQRRPPFPNLGSLSTRSWAMRKFLAALAVAALIPAGLWADEIRGQVTKVDVSKNRLTLMVGDKERVIMVTPKVRVITMVESRRVFPRRTSVQEYITSLDQLQTGTMVTVMTETQ